MGPWQQNPRRAVTLQPYEAAGTGEGKRKKQGKRRKKRRGFPFRIVGSGHGFLPFPFLQGFSFSLPLFALHSAEHLRRAFQGALAQRLVHKGGCGGPFRVLKRPSARNGYFGLVSYTCVGWASDDSVEHSPTSFVRICNTSASRASFPSWEPNGRPWQGVPCNREGTSGMLGQETGSVMAGHAYAGGES